MKFKVGTLFFLVFQFAFYFAATSQQVVLKQNNASGIYGLNEPISVRLFLNHVEADSIKIKIDKNYANTAPWKQVAVSGEARFYS